MKRLKIIEPANPNRSTAMVNGVASGVLNWDDIAYPSLHRSYSAIKANFWTPEEISMSGDKQSYDELTDRERNAFNMVIALLATLDGPQGRYLWTASEFLTDPAAQAVLLSIAYQEVIHNQSYSYILSSITDQSNQDAIFNAARTEELIIKRNEPIMGAYNDLMFDPSPEHLVRSLVQSNILEGLNFYSGFFLFYNFARNGKMLGSTRVINYINRDELVHNQAVSEILGMILGENPELNTPEFAQYVFDAVEEAVDNELTWSRDILAGIEGILMSEVESYIKYRANKILSLMGLDELYPGYGENTVSWIRVYVDQFSAHTDFFEGKSRSYSRASGDDGLDDLFG